MNSKIINLNEGEKFTLIDLSSLEIECRDLPQVYLKVSQEYAKACSERDTAKNEIKKIDAKLSRQIRENPAEFNLEKVTDKIVPEVVDSHEDHIKAYEDFLQKAYKADQWEAVKNSLDKKDKMIDVLARLYANNYWRGDKSASKISVEKVGSIEAEEEILKQRKEVMKARMGKEPEKELNLKEVGQDKFVVMSREELKKYIFENKLSMVKVFKNMTDDDIREAIRKVSHPVQLQSVKEQEEEILVPVSAPKISKPKISKPMVKLPEKGLPSRS